MIEYPKNVQFNSCNGGIVAIAAITRLDYLDVREWFRAADDRPAQWRGGIEPDRIVDCLRAFGVDHVEYDREPRQKFTHWVAAHCADLGKFLIFHPQAKICALDDGFYLDNREIYHFQNSKISRRKVIHAIQIKH